MKVTAEIDISPSLYFEHLCDITIKDIKKATGKSVCLKDLIDGYHYKKILNYKKHKVNLDMKVGPLIENKYFILSYETKDTKCSYYYDFFIRDGKNYVTYNEDNNYKKDNLGSKLAKLKHKLFEKSLKIKIFNNIELTTKYIKNHQKKEEI